MVNFHGHVDTGPFRPVPSRAWGRLDITQFLWGGGVPMDQNLWKQLEAAHRQFEAIDIDHSGLIIPSLQRAGCPFNLHHAGGPWDPDAWPAGLIEPYEFKEALHAMGLQVSVPIPLPSPQRYCLAGVPPSCRAPSFPHIAS